MPTGLQKEIVKRLRLFNKGEITGQPIQPRKSSLLFENAHYQETTAQRFSSTLGSEGEEAIL